MSQPFMRPLFMRRPTLDGLPALPTLPPGYTLRPYRDGELDAFVSVLCRAFDDETWTPERARTALIEMPEVDPVLVIDWQGTPVATASAWHRPEYPGSGYVHWVAVDPAHQGHGLGSIVTLAVLRAFAEQGCHDAVLETDDPRLPAIRTYWKLGFRPEHRDPTHPARWAAVEAHLFKSAGR